MQAIRDCIEQLPRSVAVSWVKGHQDRDISWGDLSPAAKANIFADEWCTLTYNLDVASTGLFPEWIPGTRAALMHRGKLVPKKIPQYTVIASTAPCLREYLMDKSAHWDPMINDRWDDATFNDIDWRYHSKSIQSLSPPIKIQISKYIHNWTRNRMDNAVDSRCFTCGQLHEDVLHVLQCPSADRHQACNKALNELSLHSSRYYTPLPMLLLISQSIASFLKGDPVTPPNYQAGSFGNDHDERLHALLKDAFERQS